MTKKTPERKHALLSPSSAKTWTTCPASVVIGKDMPNLPASEYAKEGTRAHAYAEKYLVKALNGAKDWEKGVYAEVADEMAEHVVNYVNFCLTVRDNYAKTHTVLLTEVEKTIVNTDNNWGTADFLMLGKKNDSYSLVIIDLKYGRGNVVSVENNNQLANYAVAGQKTLKVNVDMAYVYVYQPRTPGREYERWVIDKDTLKQWAKEFKASESKVLKMIRKEIPVEYNAGDMSHCKYCKVLPVCEAFKKAAASDALVVLKPLEKESLPDLPKPTDLDVSTLVKILERKKIIEHFLDEAENYLLNMMTQGTAIEGYKLVSGRRQRRWIKGSEDDIAAKLSARGVSNPWRQKLLTLGEAEKELGKDAAEKISDLVTLTTPKLQIARADDKRPGIDAASELQALLSEINED